MNDDKTDMNESMQKAIIEVFDKAAKYDQLIKDLGVEMRDPNGTIWDEAKRLQKENKRLEWENITFRSALIHIRDGFGPIDPATKASIALKHTANTNQ